MDLGGLFLRGHKDDRGLAIIEDVLDGVGQQGGIDRDRHGTGTEPGQVTQDPLEPVL